MIIVSEGTTVLNVEKVISLLVATTPKITKTKISSGFLGMFPKYKEVSENQYTLTFRYVCAGSNSQSTYIATHSDLFYLRKCAKDIVDQIKSYDSSFVDRAFEDAVLKGK